MRARSRLLFRPAADEVNNFQAVTIMELSFQPTLAGHDLAVEFNGNAVCLHTENLHEGSEGKARG